MIIDFRVRAPFPAYAASPLFTHLDAVERDTRTRVDAPSPASARAFSLDLLLREADEAGVDKLVVPVRKAAATRTWSRCCNAILIGSSAWRASTCPT